MINKNKILTIGISSLLCINFAINSVYAEIAKIDNDSEYKNASALEIVANPQTYLNQKVKINAIFDRFSTLGLDYKPVMRESKNYISFLIRRDDVTDHVIPLSELKLIIKRDKAEKLADLESGDKIEITGQIVSTALNDPWIDVENIKVLSSKSKSKADTQKQTSSIVKDTKKK